MRGKSPSKRRGDGLATACDARPQAMGAPWRLCGFVIALAVTLAGCSGGTFEAPTLSLPEAPSLPDMTPPPEAVTNHDNAVGSATEIYARVARGANTCWFGGSGPLKKDYIYHAEADAPSRGGKAEITIHNRDPSQPNPRGAKAFKVKIDPNGETATLVTENLHMPEPMGTGMASDVSRWAKGDQGCAGSSTVAGWGLPAPAAEAPRTDEKTPKKPVKTAKASTKPKPQ